MSAYFGFFYATATHTTKVWVREDKFRNGMYSNTRLTRLKYGDRHPIRHHSFCGTAGSRNRRSWFRVGSRVGNCGGTVMSYSNFYTNRGPTQ